MLVNLLFLLFPIVKQPESPCPQQPPQIKGVSLINPPVALPTPQGAFGKSSQMTFSFKTSITSEFIPGGKPPPVPVVTRIFPVNNNTK